MLVAAVILASVLAPPTAQEASAAPVAAQVRPLPDEAVRQNARLTASLSPSAKSKIQSAAATLGAAAKQQPGMSAAQIESRARASVIQTFPNLHGPDIEGVVLMVVMQSAQAEQADLEQMMGAMQKNLAGKQALRGQQTSSGGQLSDMSEADQMRLQMAMDRRSKFLTALSNVMKSASNTQAAVIGNLK